MFIFTIVLTLLLFNMAQSDNVINSTSNLSLVTYNSHGLGAGRVEYINSLVDKYDFVFLQEHWLHEEEIDQVFSNRFPNCKAHAVSGMERGILIRGRPYGGIAILWKQSIKHSVTASSVISRRFCAIVVEFENMKILMCSVYMPGDENAIEYEETLQEINRLFVYHDVDRIIIGGDFNVDWSRTHLDTTNQLELFVRSESLRLITDHGEIDFTYESKINNSKSVLDHFFVTENMLSEVSELGVNHDVDNVSDHSPVFVEFDLRVDHGYGEEVYQPQNMTNWNKLTPDHIAEYKVKLDGILKNRVNNVHCNRLKCNDHGNQIEVLHDEIIDACITTAEECFPRTVGQRPKSEKRLPGWNENFRELRERAILWHNIWKAGGSQRQGLVFEIRKTTRTRYHHAIKMAKKEQKTEESNKIAMAYIDKNDNDFWKMINKKKGKCRSHAVRIDDAMNDKDIADRFADKYEALFSSVGYDENQMKEIITELDDDIDRSCKHNKCKCDQHTISSIEVRSAIGKLKVGKHDGAQQLYSDHLIYGTEELDSQLAMLFTLMLTHSYIPESFKRAIITPIPKDKRKSLNDSENYRGIALSSVLGKVFDHILMEKNQSIFCSSDLQFGFKKKSSTTQCTFVLKEVVEYYMARGTNVYVTLLDASRAFDRVEYVKLFKLLIKRQCCPLIAKFLASLYTCQHVQIKWNDTLSRIVNVKNGIKQGGVLSPILFNIYSEEMLQRLKMSGFGCHVGDIFMGALAYADDVVLLCPTKYGLNRMLTICDVFSEEYKLLFNITKTHLLFYSSQSVNVFIQWLDKRIDSEERAIHLGHIVGPNVEQNVIDEIVSSMYAKTNALISEFGHCDCQVKYRLFKSFIMVLYGSVLWDYSSRFFSRFLIAWRKCIRKLLRLPYRAHSALLPMVCADISPEYQIFYRYLKFITAAQMSENILVRTCANIVTNGSRSNSGKNLTLCSVNLGFEKHKIPHLRELKNFYDIKSSDNAEMLKEVLHMRDYNDFTIFSKNELKEVIYWLSCN